MNVAYLKYALEIEKTGSISKAADNLYMGQPNLSRAIKDLEESLGITIFKRTSKGIAITPEGSEFLNYAKKIIYELDNLENMYKGDKIVKQKFSISVPRASYFADAFSKFVQTANLDEPLEFFYKETNSMRAINNILQADYKLGIIRYQSAFDNFFRELLEEKGLDYRVITGFSYDLLMSKKNPLAFKDEIHFEDLDDYVEIAHGDPYVPSLPFIEVKKLELSKNINKRIFIFERASEFTLLEDNPKTFMWVSPIPDDLLEKYHLVEKKCVDNDKVCKDVLIFRKGYKFTPLEDRFIDEVCNMKRKLKVTTDK